MTKQEFLAAIKADDKEALLEMLSPLLDNWTSMLKAGVLKRNVVRNITNQGIGEEAANMLADVAEIRAQA